jgi:hypothetical protein
MTLNDMVNELGDEFDDYLALNDHDFEVDSSWRYEIDLEYAQGDWQ